MTNIINNSIKTKNLINIFEDFENSIKERKFEGFNELTIFIEIINNIITEKNQLIMLN